MASFLKSSAWKGWRQGVLHLLELLGNWRDPHSGWRPRNVFVILYHFHSRPHLNLAGYFTGNRYRSFKNRFTGTGFKSNTVFGD